MKTVKEVTLRTELSLFLVHCLKEDVLLCSAPIGEEPKVISAEETNNLIADFIADLKSKGLL